MVLLMEGDNYIVCFIKKNVKVNTVHIWKFVVKKKSERILFWQIWNNIYKYIATQTVTSVFTPLSNDS